MSRSQRDARLKSCTNCTHGCCSSCSKGKYYKNEVDLRVHTPLHTPQTTTPYQNYLMYSTPYDQRHPKVNASMNDKPVFTTPIPIAARDYIQSNTASRFLAPLEPFPTTRRPGGINGPFFH